MTPQFDTRPLSCKQRQQARVKSSYSLGFLRIAVSGAESNQPHALSVAWNLSQGAKLSIALISALLFRSERQEKESQHLENFQHGANALPATLSSAWPVRCQGIWSTGIERPFANSEKRMHYQRYQNPKRQRRHLLKTVRRKEMRESNGGMITGQASSILTGTSVPI